MDGERRSSRSLLLIGGLILGLVLGSSSVAIGGSALLVDTEGDLWQDSNGWNGLLTFDQPFGEYQIARGKGDAQKTVQAVEGLVSAIVLDAPSGGGSTTVEVRDRFGLLWQGTVPAGGHLMDSPEGGIWWTGNLRIESSGGSARFMLYGYVCQPSECFGRTFGEVTKEK
jgi:hypothetical protein